VYHSDYLAGTIWSAPPTAALWLSAELLAPCGCSSQTVSYEESQSGGVAAALQIFRSDTLSWVENHDFNA
jgi:hypothetical protein